MKRLAFILLLTAFSLSGFSQSSGGIIMRKSKSQTVGKGNQRNTRRKSPAAQKGAKGKQKYLTPLEQIVVGDHLLSLQWISWEYFGKINIKKLARGKYYCKGEQRLNSDYLKVEGNLKIVSEDHLVIDGFIETRVSYLNHGNVCHREGVFDFVRTQNRRYWRCQQFSNCEGSCDYVDIYMK